MTSFGFYFGFDDTQRGAVPAGPTHSVRLTADADYLGVTLAWERVRGGPISQEFLRITQGDTTHPTFEPDGDGTHRIAFDDPRTRLAEYQAVLQYNQDAPPSREGLLNINTAPLPFTLIDLEIYIRNDTVQRNTGGSDFVINTERTRQTELDSDSDQFWEPVVGVSTTTESNTVTTQILPMPAIIVAVDTDGFDTSDRTTFTAQLPAGYLTLSSRDPDLAFTGWRMSLRNPEGTFTQSDSENPVFTDPNEPVAGEYTFTAESIVRDRGGNSRTGAVFNGSFRIHHTNPLILMTDPDFFGIDFNWAPRQGAVVSNVTFRFATDPQFTQEVVVRTSRTGNYRVQLQGNNEPQRVYGRLEYNDHNGDFVVGDTFSDIEHTIPAPNVVASGITYRRGTRSENNSTIRIDSGLPAELFQLAAMDPDIQSVLWHVIVSSDDNAYATVMIDITTHISPSLNFHDRVPRGTVLNIEIVVYTYSDTGRGLTSPDYLFTFTTP